MRVLISGANRGIGLELVKQLAEQGHTVIGTARQPDHAAKLNIFANAPNYDVTVIQMDTTDSASVQAAYKNVSAKVDGLDLLINNAGIFPNRGGLETLTVEESIHVMHVNAIAPVFVARTFLPLLKTGMQPKLVNISSQLGSISNKTSGGYYDYCASKAALNMYTRALSADLKPFGITTVCVHPGWVQTDMGGSSASLTPPVAVQGMVKLFTGLSPENNGKFYQWNGETLPW